MQHTYPSHTFRAFCKLASVSPPCCRNWPPCCQYWPPPVFLSARLAPVARSFRVPIGRNSPTRLFPALPLAELGEYTCHAGGVRGRDPQHHRGHRLGRQLDQLLADDARRPGRDVRHRRRQAAGVRRNAQPRRHVLVQAAHR